MAKKRLNYSHTKKRRRYQRLWVYLYPFSAFRKEASDEVIIAAHDSGVEFGYGSKVRRFPPQQLADIINDESFAYSAYWVRFIAENPYKPLPPYQRVTHDDLQFHESDEVEYFDVDDIFRIEVLYNEMALRAASSGHHNNIPFMQIRTEGVIPEILYEAVVTFFDEY